MELECPRCGYLWDYQGKSEWYTSCPRCKTSINVRKKKVSKNGSKSVTEENKAVDLIDDKKEENKQSEVKKNETN